MAESRLIKTRFWRDNYTANISKEEKLVFLYALTNESTNISGIYEIPIRTIAIDTGLTEKQVEKTLAKFEADRKMVYLDGWLALKNFQKNQQQNPSVKKGIERELALVPPHIIEALDSLSTDCTQTGTRNLTKPNLTKRSSEDAPPPEEEETPQNPAKIKKPCGMEKNVMLTDEEKNKLIERYGRTAAKKYVDDLSLYLKSRNKRYASHYAVILSWMRRDKVELYVKPTEAPAPQPEEEISPEKQQKLAEMRENIKNSLTRKK